MLEEIKSLFKDGDYKGKVEFLVLGPWCGEFSYELSWWNPGIRKIRNEDFKEENFRLYTFFELLKMIGFIRVVDNFFSLKYLRANS